MAENNCESRAPGEYCKFGAQFDMLERRVDVLEKEQDAETKFRKDYYHDREQRIRRDAEIDFKMTAMDGKLDSMNEKLTVMTKWKNEHDNRPNELLDSIKHKLVSVLVGAVGASLVAAVAYLIKVAVL